MNFKQINIAIQGIKGSYHHEVATLLYDNCQITTCSNFSDIPPLLVSRKVAKAVMAIENSIAGAILPNYALLDEYKLVICGEYYLQIHHQLMALKGQTLNDIKEVWSHPMALEQCRKFFRKYPHIKLIEEKDTAEVAQMIQNKQLKGIAAIAGKKAAEIYDLNIIADEIQTHPDNYTRFVLVTNELNQAVKIFSKVSLKFTLTHEAGNLWQILEILKNNNLNMSKIQSLPIVEKPWEYAFFIDVLVDDVSAYNKAEKEIKHIAKEFKVLGKYDSTIKK